MTAQPTPVRTRVVIAEDSGLLRDGLVRLLAESGFDVSPLLADAGALMSAVEAARPDLVVIDIRMPPTFTDEGVRAASRCASYPGLGVLVFSPVHREQVRHRASRPGRGRDRLPAQGPGRRRRDSSTRSRVAAGGTVLDPEVVTQLLSATPGDPLTLTPGSARCWG